jgi:hypothetical protein
MIAIFPNHAVWAGTAGLVWGIAFYWFLAVYA